MSNSTSNISDLPTNDSINISTSQEPQQQQKQQQQQQPTTLHPDTINQLINGLQQANISGATQLQSRDLPMETQPLQMDEECKPSFVPSSDEKYISEDKEQEIQNIVHNYEHDNKKYNYLGQIFEKLQTPILLGILFYIFQLQWIKLYLFRIFPTLFAQDGNITTNGLILYSILFAFSYYFINESFVIVDNL